jgi:hypothetical protein
MLSEEQIKKLIELEKEEMVLISRKTDFAKQDNPDDKTKIELQRIDLRLEEIENEADEIKDLPKLITRDKLAKELEVSNRTEDELIEEHSNKRDRKRLEIEEQIRKYVNEYHVK